MEKHGRRSGGRRSAVAGSGGTRRRGCGEPRIDLRVLVVDNGDAPVQAITAQLKSTGIPYTTVDLTDADRPTVTAAFLSDTVGGTPRAKFQGVVLPNEAPFGEGSAEQTALESYERTYGIPQVDAYTWAHPGVGLDYTSEGGFAGSLDGQQASVTAQGKSGYFGYLDGAFAFEDNDPSVLESYGFVARPRAGFTSYVDVPVPGGSGRGSLVGEYTDDGRRQLVVTFAYNQYQQQFRVLARGIVEWLTQESTSVRPATTSRCTSTTSSRPTPAGTPSATARPVTSTAWAVAARRPRRSV